jgi:hypothetical protein
MVCPQDGVVMFVWQWAQHDDLCRPHTWLSLSTKPVSVPGQHIIQVALMDDRRAYTWGVQVSWFDQKRMDPSEIGVTEYGVDLVGDELRIVTAEYLGVRRRWPQLSG